MKQKFAFKIILAFCDLFFYLLRKKSAQSDNSVKNVVVVSLHLLGDSVFTVPAIRVLYEKYNERLILVCFPESEPIFREMFSNIRIKIIEKNEFYLRRIAGQSARRKIRQLEPSHIFDLTGVITSATLLAGVKSDEIFGFNEIYYRNVYTKYTPKRNKPHLIDLYLEVVKLAGHFYPESIKEFPCEAVNGGRILINHTAGWAAKEWGNEKFVRLAAALKKQYPVAIIAQTGTISDEMLKQMKSEGVELISTRSIEALIKEIKNCSVFIGNDSGPLYIAGMLGKPTFTIYGPTNPAFSLPAGGNHGFVRRNIPCSPDSLKQYCRADAGRRGCSNFICMNGLGYEAVYAELENFLLNLKIK